MKNTLVKRASQGTAFEDVAKALKGRSSIAYTQGDIVALAKALTKYAKGNPELSFKAGVVEGKVVDGCLECPWHGSRFALPSGHLRRGPTVYDQPSYEVRARDDGGYEVRRRPA